MRVEFLEPARQELMETVRYYDKQQAGLGDRFVAQVRAAINRILAHPHAWRKLTSTERRCRVRRFRYGIVYQVAEERILIVAVMHLHRKPGYWSDRVGHKGEIE